MSTELEALAPPNTTADWKVLVVDDHSMIREGLRCLIDRQPSLSVCGEADCVASALRASRQHSPELVIVDLSLVGSNGLDLVQQMNANRTDVKLLVYSHRPAWVMTEKVIQAGAHGYVEKTTNDGELIEAIQIIKNGGYFRSKNSQAPVEHPLADGVQALAEKEYLVFEYLGMGKEPREIAELLGCSPNTVRTYLDRCSKKLGTKKLGELRCAAMSWRLDALL